MSQLNLALALGAGVVLALGLVSGYVKNRLWISEPAIALLIGILLGPALFTPAAIEFSAEQENTFLREAARITLAISVMGAALRLPYAYEARWWRDLVVILGPGMLLMWLAGSLVAYVVLGLPALLALLVGAILCPTDPVLADSIVTGRLADEAVPGRMRYAISAESGANDGLALLLVMLPVMLLEHPSGQTLLDWLDEVLIRQVIAGVVAGLAIGWIAGRCLRWAYEQPFSERTSIIGIAIALSITVLAVDRLLGTAAILAVFVAGLAFNRVTAAREEAWHEHMQEAIGRFFDIPIFILLGSLLPWQAWLDLGWIAVAFALAVLLLRRLPAWFLLSPLLACVRNRRETLFNGWFGPIGIAAILYATEVRHHVERGEEIWALVSLVVSASVVLHGVTATPFTSAYGRHASAADRVDDEPDVAEEASTRAR